MFPDKDSLFDHRLRWLESVRPERRILRKTAYLRAKRGLDLLIVMLVFPLWAPVLALCVLLIKLESPFDPVFFLQQRTGKGGRRFSMYKFRTMVVNAEALKEQLQHLNELQYPDFKISNDPRITRVGWLLRKTSLDELPQLINVIRGDMSLVGPRPTSFSSDTYQLWQTERLDVIPGITGLWQIVGRGSTEFDVRLRLDIAYIERSCLWLDLQILFRTFSCVLQQHGTL